MESPLLRRRELVNKRRCRGVILVPLGLLAIAGSSANLHLRLFFSVVLNVFVLDFGFIVNQGLEKFHLRVIVRPYRGDFGVLLFYDDFDFVLVLRLS